MEPSSLLPILTSDLTNSIREHPILAPHTWYIIAATTLTILNRPDEVPRIYEHAITFGSENIEKKLVEDFSKVKGKKVIPFHQDSDLTDYLQLYSDLSAS